MKNLSIAVVGSNGFIGRHLVEKLIDSDNVKSITLLSRGKYPIYNITSVNKKIDYFSIDIKNIKTYQNYFENVDIVYFLTSETIPSSSWNNPHQELEINIQPFLIFLDFLTQKGIRKIIFTSSAGTIYGPSDKKITEMSVANPFSPHGIAKLTMEYFLEYYRVNHNINHEIYRISNVYGEHQKTEKGLGIINTFLENYINKKESSVFGNGKAVRNYIYVKDVAQVLVNATINSIHESLLMNLASNDNITVNNVIKKIETSLNIKIPIKYINQRSSDNPNILVSNSLLLKKYPNQTFTSFEDGIKQTYLHLKSLENDK